MDTAHSPGTTGRRWAYFGLGLGLTVSMCANVAHSYVPPAAAAHDWRPAPGAVVGALFWPLALFVAIEILARVEWPDEVRWRVFRWGGLVPVAAVAALVSYRHMSGLLTHYSEDAVTARFGPLAVDGLMVMATAALLATSGTWGRAADVPAAHVPEDVPSPIPAHVPTVKRHTADTPPAHPHLAAVPTPKRRVSGTRRGTPATEEQMLAAVQAIRTAGRAVGRRNLLAQLRADTLTCSNDRADQFLATLNADTRQEA